MCNKNGLASLLATNTQTHTKDPLTAQAIGVSSPVDLSVGEQRPRPKKHNTTLSKWAELREECAQYSCFLSCMIQPYSSYLSSYLSSPFDIRRPLRIELCRAPNTNSVISNERRLRTHTHKDPLTALLAIGVSSSALSGNKKEQRPRPKKRLSS